LITASLSASAFFSWALRFPAAISINK
jgi:hypothetical protein